jgi:hypothetical protein
MRRVDAGNSENSVTGISTFSARVIEPNSAPSWNVMPMRRRTASRSSGEAL